MTTQGVPIHIRGQIDAYRYLYKNNTSFVNIIDYKSSNQRQFKFEKSLLW